MSSFGVATAVATVTLLVSAASLVMAETKTTQYSCGDGPEIRAEYIGDKAILYLGSERFDLKKAKDGDYRSKDVTWKVAGKKATLAVKSGKTFKCVAKAK